ncbi:MAG: hypothetical protein LUE29_00860 [Lachnospiraceae bacterium]|nr:hypothetical protein [Lachnospiraceae bacterium]
MTKKDTKYPDCPMKFKKPDSIIAHSKMGFLVHCFMIQGKKAGEGYEEKSKGHTAVCFEVCTADRLPVMSGRLSVFGKWHKCGKS